MTPLIFSLVPLDISSMEPSHRSTVTALISRNGWPPPSGNDSRLQVDAVGLLRLVYLPFGFFFQIQFDHPVMFYQLLECFRLAFRRNV
jgi:hypothetical protein